MPIEKVKRLTNPMLVLFVASKAIIGLGLGLLLAPYIGGLGWGFLILGIILSIPGWVAILKK